jgi:ubiquinone/menaquinone biosynthesis C-methylase UbiE
LNSELKSFEGFPWPALSAEGPAPTWDGSQFIIGTTRSKILSYSQTDSAWSEELTQMHEREASSSHPIDLASRALAIESMRLVKAEVRPVILDVGCSSGFLVEELVRNIQKAGVIGADYLLDVVFKAAKRIPNNPFLQFDLRHCPLPNDCIDGVTALNVLEHIDDDVKALTEMFRVLKRGGLAHIEVPAGPGSFDLYDEVLLHFRRYRLCELVAKARKVGFVVRKETHLGFFSYPFFKCAKIRNQLLGKRLTLQQKRELVSQQIRNTKNSRMFAKIFDLERALGSIATYPIGIRAVARVQKV